MITLLRLLPATLKLGARGQLLQLFVLEHGQVHFYKGCRAVFGPASCWKKWFHLREAPQCACSLFVLCQAILSFVIKQFSLDNIVLGGLGTGEASVALSPFFRSSRV